MLVVELDRVLQEIERFYGYLDEDMIIRLKMAICKLPIRKAEEKKDAID